MRATAVLTAFAPLADRYQGFLFDLWGVVHEGVAPYPDTLAVLEALRARGLPVIFLSNAPRRAASVVARLDGLGVPRTAYDAVFSSGEAVHQALARREDPAFAALGQRCFVLGPPEDRSILEGIPDLEAVEQVPDAEFVLNIGPPPRPDIAVEDYRHVLMDAVAQGLPMVCANPDITVKVAGEEVICAGALAQAYEALGGSVILRGKPDPALFREAAARLRGAPERVLVVGDSLATDITGAVAAGMESLLVATGLLRERLVDREDQFDSAALAAACAETGAPAPTWAMRRLRWGHAEPPPGA